MSVGLNTKPSSLKVAWPLIVERFAADGDRSAVIEWIKLWKPQADALVGASACVAHVYLAQLNVVLGNAAAFTKVTGDDAGKIKVVLTSVAKLLQPLGLRRRAIASVYGIVHRIFQLSRVFEVAVDMIQASTLESFSTLANVATYHAVVFKNGELLPALRPKLIDLYCEHVVSARTAPNANVAYAFDTLLRYGLDSASLSEKIFPAMERMIPRTPDCLPHISQGLSVISSSYKSKPLDMTGGSAKILGAITEYIVASNETTRDYAHSIIRSLCARIPEASSLSALVEKLVALLNKNLNQWFERAGLFTAVGCVAQASPASAALGVEGAIFPLLLKNVEKEKNKDALAPAVTCLASWVALSPQKFLAQDAVLQVFVRGVADANKEVAFLYFTQLFLSLSSIGASEAAGLKLSTLIKPLSAFVTQSKTKPAVAPEAMLSLAILQQLALIGGNDEAAKAIESDKLWTVAIESCFRSQDSGITLVNDINKMLAVPTAQLALISLIANGFLASSTVRSEPAFLNAIPKLLTHENKAIRRAAATQFAKVHTFVGQTPVSAATSVPAPALSLEFSHAVLDLLETVIAESAAKHEDDRVQADALANFFKLALTPLCANLPSLVPRIIAIASHPLLKGRYTSNPFRMIAEKLATPFDTLTNSFSDDIIAYLTGPRGLDAVGSVDSPLPNAAAKAMAVTAARSAIARLLVSPLSARLVDLIYPMLTLENCNAWLSFTVAQVAIFHTAEDSTYAHVAMEEVDPKEAVSKNARKEDPRDAKKKAAEATKKATDLALAKFQKQFADTQASEKLVRLRVAPVHRSLAHGLAIVHEAARNFSAVFSYRDAFFVSMIMDCVATLTRYDTEFQGLAVHCVQWLATRCFNHKYLTSEESHLVGAIVKPGDSDLQAAIVEDLHHNAKGALDAASWAIYQPIAVAAITPLVWISGHGIANRKEDKDRGNTESSQHLPRQVQELAFTSLDHNKKHVNPTLTQCFLTALDSSPTFSSVARTSIVESAQFFHSNVPAHVASLEVLVRHLDHANAQVRLSVLDCLVSIPKLHSFGHHDDVSSKLWKTRFDTEPDNSDLAVSLYKAYSAEHPLPHHYWTLFSPLLCSTSSVVRDMAAKAIVGAMNLHSETRDETFEKVLSFHSSHYVTPDETDASNPRAVVPRSSNTADKVTEGKDWPQFRLGAAAVITQYGQLATLPEAQCARLFEYIIANALFESSTDIYKAFVDAGVQVITLQGSGQNTSVLIELFEKQLSGPSPSTPIQHRVREAVVIFLGTVVQHLPAGDKKIDAIIQRLLDVLKTPSEPVQRSVAACLEHIVSGMPDRAVTLLNHCLGLLLTPGKGGYPHQRGGAWGLAGLVKGLRPISLHQHKFIVEKIQVAFNNKQDVDARVGASLAIECFSETLGTGFEPWILYFLPNLITGLGDGQVDVREVTLEAARAVMSQLSANGVRLVLPSILAMLDDSTGKWKAKIGAIDLVGAMGHCQPGQLGQCLPQIVPRLSSLLADPHVQVQKVAKDALGAICNTIQNPEVTKIVPILLKAIDDPKLHSGPALDCLASTDFINRIDDASLSLIVPVLDRALRERSSDTKKRATKIVGIMCNLTETKALIPYQKTLSEQLKVVLADPQPVTRAMAAHALGQLVKGLDTASEIVPYLLDTMKATELGLVERIGAAQGLAHVISHMEMTGFRTSLLPRILATVDSASPAARQGYLAVFQFLPDTLGSRFEPLLEVVLPVIIKGLSDDQDMVRESALQGGQAVIKAFGDEKVDVLIPPLKAGLFDKNWRIRASSIQLLGDLLYQLSGASEDFASKDISKMLDGERALVLASLYLLRMDSMPNVAGQAVTVWKMLVVNTPKTLKVLMPNLMVIIVEQLAVGDAEREVASETLVELVAKMGDRVLGDIIPILEKELETESSETREGICIGLSAVLETVSRHHIAEYFDLLLPAVTKTLCDTDASVRSAAAGAFDSLHKGVGDRAVNECLPILLTRMEDSDAHVSHCALQGVQQLLIARSQLILPILLPKLISLPMTSFNAKALASIAEVAGSGLTTHLSTLIPTLIRLRFAEPEGSPNVPQDDPEVLTRALHAVVLSSEGSGLGRLLTELARFTSDSFPSMRIAALNLLGFYAKTKGKTHPKGWASQISAVIGLALRSYHDRDVNVVKSAIASLSEVMATIDIETVADSPTNYIQVINDTVESLHVPDTLEGFCVPGGLTPLLPIFGAAMRYGTSEMREQVSLGLRNMIAKTDRTSLTSSVVQAIAGPLIRILSEPNLESRIRADVLSTLNLLAERGSDGIKSFNPTLQVTYIKAISSTFKPTREQAAIGLGRLISLGAKPDFLIKAMAPALKAAAATKPEECLSAIAQVYRALTADVLEATSNGMRDALLPFMSGASTSGHTQRSKAAEALATTLRFQAPEQALAKLKSLKLIDSAPSDLAEAGFLAVYHLMTLNTAFGTYLTQQEDMIEDMKLGLSVGDTPFIRGAAGQALAYLLVFVDDEQAANDYARALAESLDEDDSVDVKVAVLNGIRYFAKAAPGHAADLLSVLVPSALQRVKKSMLSLKYAAERALYHLLQVRTNPTLHTHFATTLPESHTKTFLDFCKVVLSKLPEHSDDEDAFNDYDD